MEKSSERTFQTGAFLTLPRAFVASADDDHNLYSLFPFVGASRTQPFEREQISGTQE